MAPARTVTELARAKINLCLHVTGQRGDGYHLLDSLVVFADVADRVSATTADTLSLEITGPGAAGLSSASDNLVLRAAQMMGVSRGAAVVLEKQLPVASGIGGGSADAAATLRALSALWGVGLPSQGAVLALGADVPVCLSGVPARMEGVGEVVTPLPHPLPAAWLVLANPGFGLATPDVFRALTRRDHPPLPRVLPRLAGAADLAAFLHMQRNDLEPVALRVAPLVGRVKDTLAAQPGCLLARMSGSGATCFGLFADPLGAAAAVSALRLAEPRWWVAAGAMMA